MLTAVRDIPNSYVMICVSSEVSKILEHCTSKENFQLFKEEYKTLFIDVSENGEISSIYGITNNIPFNHLPVYHIYGRQ